MPGDITVTFPSGNVTTVHGPMCPDEEVVVGDGRVDLRPADGDGVWPGQPEAVPGD